MWCYSTWFHFFAEPCPGHSDMSQPQKSEGTGADERNIKIGVEDGSMQGLIYI